MKQIGLIGIFDDFDSFIAALKDVRGMKPDGLSTFTPTPCHEVEEIFGGGPSPIRFFTLIGGLAGFAIGAALTVFCPLAYPLIVGGKPLISVPPSLIIAFELTILFSTILSTIGFFVLSPFRGPRLGKYYDPSFSKDRFGILVAVPETEALRYQEAMKKHDAVETRIR
jgi:hypothetical protein